MPHSSTGGTTTGAVLENMILPALVRGGYVLRQQVTIGTRPTGRAHKVDVIAAKATSAFLVSVKWQQVSGTAEQKVPFEVMCLIDAVRGPQSEFTAAYLVLGGSGWTTRDFYVQGGLTRYMPEANLINIVSLEDFVGRANRGAL